MCTSRRSPVARGKFLEAGGRRLYVTGVTYGTFRPDAAGDPYPPPATVVHDLALVAAHGINAVRTYTLPPNWFLDAAQEHGLLVLPSLGAEQVVGHLNDGRRAQARVETQLVEKVRRCAGHPALLGYSIANEIPASTVRWLGPRRVERFLEHLSSGVRNTDPRALVTYVNYPSTEYLELPFLDFVSFNVFLEQEDRLVVYLARLQNLAGDRPLLMTELGLDSLRNGEEEQARSLRWQLRTAFTAGCAGTFVYAWTDEWHCAGQDMDDWAFGLTDRHRHPKPALHEVRDVYARVPFPDEGSWPRISVVVCAYNAEPMIRECLAAAMRLDYPDYEVLVVDDGSTDATAELATAFPVRVISTENRGLGSARNVGLAAADGEIVAYLDSDAYPDPQWLRYMAHAFTSDIVGVGGPNLPPAGDGVIAECVARAPGGPAHVLLADSVAEHLPGCNLAVRASALREIGGFDPRFRTAGDDVDVCWRLQNRGGRLGFHPAAVVWHHRRNSIRAYWRQQRGYGRAEALLEDKWPDKYNAGGHFRWTGRIYDRGLTRHLVKRQQIYHGSWGTAPFQRLYQRAPGTLLSLLLTPEWLLVVTVLAGLALVDLLTAPPVIGLLLAGVAAAAVCPVLLQAWLSTRHMSFPDAPRTPAAVVSRRLLTTLLHLLQPVARLSGRLRNGLTPWRGHRVRGLRIPVPRSGWTWSERWIAPEERLCAVEGQLTAAGNAARRGGDFDRWDLEIRNGPLGSARLLLGVEGTGDGAQLTRYRCWPVVRRVTVGAVLSCAAIALVAAAGGMIVLAWTAAGAAVVLGVLATLECGAAVGALLAAVPAGGGAGEGEADPAGSATRLRWPSHRVVVSAGDPHGSRSRSSRS